MAAWTEYAPNRRSTQRPLDESLTLRNQTGVPPRAVLVLEQDDVSFCGRARVAAGLLEEHQPKQPDRLRVGQQAHEQPP